ncbi:MAG: FAD binding domain-containing protein, partial [Deltaproteobacteria bacterium]|nr:FAD binding domain-containing protein [Deltaproteobacteria bacterium]
MLTEFGEKARLYAGGTELLLAMKHDLLRYEHLVDVKTISGLNRIEQKNGAIVIGGTATHRAIEQSAVVQQNLPVFAEMETKVANVRVRASGTLGGNLCFAEPHSDPATLLMALGAKVNVTGRSGARSVGIDELITGGYETSMV